MNLYAITIPNKVLIARWLKESKNSPAGEYSILSCSAGAASGGTPACGLLFYQAGIVVLNLGGSSALAGAANETGEAIDVGLGQLITGGTDTISPVFEVRDPIHGIINGMDE